MKLSEKFIVHSMDGETLLVPTAEADFRGIVRCNNSVEVILCALEKGADSEEELVEALTERFDGDEAEMREDVLQTVEKLREIGAIVDR